MTSNIFISLSEEQLKQLIRTCIEEALANHSPKKITIKAEGSENMLNVEEAAAYLDLATQTLYEKTSKKLIPHYKKGKKLYFIESDLREWLLAGKIKTIQDTKI